MLISVRALAEQMGVTPRTLRRWLRADGVPVVRPSRRTDFVRWSDWASWMADHTEVQPPAVHHNHKPAQTPAAVQLPPQLRALNRALGRAE